MAAYTTTQSSPGLLDTLRNTWGSRGNAKPALGLDLERSLEDLQTQRPKKGFLRSVVASFCLAPAVHGERTNPKLTDGLTDDEEDADAASEAITEVSPPLSLRYTGLGQAWNMKREEAFRARLEKCRRSGAVLVLLRHGESEWNAKDQFTGWADVGMTDEGRKQAVNAGHRLAASGVRRFDDLHSSALKRTVDTLSVVLEALSGASLPKGPRGTVSRSEMPRGTRDQSTHCRAWQLNERHYGALTGVNKHDARDQYGEAQVKAWRRSWACSPPPMSDDHPCYAALQSAYRDAGGDPDELPRSESLSACEKRTTAYYENVIKPQLERGRSVLVAAHNNVIRTLMHHLDRRGFGEVDQGLVAELSALDIPYATPLVYTFSRDGGRLAPFADNAGQGAIRGTFLT